MDTIWTLLLHFVHGWCFETPWYAPWWCYPQCHSPRICSLIYIPDCYSHSLRRLPSNCHVNRYVAFFFGHQKGIILNLRLQSLEDISSTDRSIRFISFRLCFLPFWATNWLLYVFISFQRTIFPFAMFGLFLMIYFLAFFVFFPNFNFASYLWFCFCFTFFAIYMLLLFLP